MKSKLEVLVRVLTVSTFASALFLYSNVEFAQTAAKAKKKGDPWPVPAEFSKVKNPITVDEAALAEGEDIYVEQCQSCHGPTGKGDGTKTDKIEILCGDFTSAEFAKSTDGDIFWKSTEGRQPMPSFKEKINEKQAWEVVSFVRTLRKAK